MYLNLLLDNSRAVKLGNSITYSLLPETNLATVWPN